MDKKAKNQTLIVKLICLALSFGLWMYILNVENPIREYRLENVPVEIINQDVLKEYNLALVPNQKLHVNLNLEGPINEVYSVK
ncbi:MAG: CdaR family protein, partial [Sarcina sp.]